MSVANLSKARKAKARAGKKARADANAVKFGRTQAEKDFDAARTAKARAELDAHRRDE